MLRYVIFGFEVFLVALILYTIIRMFQGNRVPQLITEHERTVMAARASVDDRMIDKIESIIKENTKIADNISETVPDLMNEEKMTAMVGAPLEALTDIEGLSDLSGLRGIGPKYKELLNAAGFNSIYKLAECDAEDLIRRVVETNKKAMIVKQSPPRSRIISWQYNAKNIVKEVLASAAPMPKLGRS